MRIVATVAILSVGFSFVILQPNILYLLGYDSVGERGLWARTGACG